jgi:hypothetical protein
MKPQIQLDDIKKRLVNEDTESKTSVASDSNTFVNLETMSKKNPNTTRRKRKLTELANIRKFPINNNACKNILALTIDRSLHRYEKHERRVHWDMGRGSLLIQIGRIWKETTVDSYSG